jgi:hypothetical protein
MASAITVMEIEMLLDVSMNAARTERGLLEKSPIYVLISWVQ